MVNHRWKFFRAGGVDQVVLRDFQDVAHLPELDPKLWVALAMPTRGVELDAKMLDHLDADKDGRVRIPRGAGGGQVRRGIASSCTSAISSSSSTTTSSSRASTAARATEVAALPRGSERSFDDPFAEKRRPLKLYAALIILAGLALGWFFGKLDGCLPEGARSSKVLRTAAPASAPSAPGTPAKPSP